MLRNFLDKLLNRQQDLVKEIIKSLQTDGDSWIFEIAKAKYLNWSGSQYASQEFAILTHPISNICLKDDDFKDEFGWYISNPKNYQLSKYESKILSEAVKSWKESQYIKKLDPNYKLLSESQKEVDLMFNENL